MSPSVLFIQCLLSAPCILYLNSSIDTMSLSALLVKCIVVSYADTKVVFTSICAIDEVTPCYGLQLCSFAATRLIFVQDNTRCQQCCLDFLKSDRNGKPQSSVYLRSISGFIVVLGAHVQVCDYKSHCRAR